MLQAQDGSFFGTVEDDNGNQFTVAFDASGTLRWSVPNEDPKIALSNGGVIAASGFAYDLNGSFLARVDELPTYSWKGAYRLGCIDSVLPAFDLAFMAASFAAVPKGNLAGNGFSLSHKTFGLVFCGPSDNVSCSFQSTPVTDMTFSYQPDADDTNIANAVNFGADHPEWAYALKLQAHKAFRAAFDHFPTVIAKHEKPIAFNAFYATASPKYKFDHTFFISGLWNYARDRQPGDAVPANGKTVNNSGYGLSYVYYLPIMRNAQFALEAMHVPILHQEAQPHL